MPALHSQPKIVTLDQYEALLEDIRAEVFDGQIYYIPVYHRATRSSPWSFPRY